MKIDYSYISFKDNPKATAASEQIARTKAYSFFAIICIIGTIGGPIFGWIDFKDTVPLIVWILVCPVFSISWLYSLITGPKRLEKALNPDGLTGDQITNRLQENKEKANEYLRLDPSSPDFVAAAKSNQESPETFMEKCQKIAETGQVNGSLAQLK